ncbi:hypothetical protein [Paraglaciecola sp. L3A3]|uniref:hypothetical protein n=1 Tax=Paraglaciecola sp. L3A3 TaxID=2686358 RepID=UPI00131B38E9|nr:hypothetical protein [Paraglaciecola sp. L3A3]
MKYTNLVINSLTNIMLGVRNCLLILITLLTLGCFDSANKSTDDPTSNPAGESTITSIITVVNTRGMPLTDVTATSDTFTIQSQAYNEQSQLQIDLDSSSSYGVIRLSKAGYSDAILFQEHSELSQSHTVTLLERAPAIIFDAFLGGELTGIDGATVSIPSESLVRADGSLVTGNVELYITPIDIQDEMTAHAFPGSFYGLPNADEIPVGLEVQQQLFSFGVTEFSFYENGEELQLKEGAVAEIELPIYVSKNIYDEDLVIGGKIPLWSLNESTGLWEQQGEGTIVANPQVESGFSLSGTTTHFTYFNADQWGLSSSGSASAEDRRVCELSITLVGAVIGQPTYFSITSFFGGPISTLPKLFTYDGTDIRTIIPQGANVRANAEQGERIASDIIRCYEESLAVDLVLEETLPEFTRWSLKAEPVFSRESDNDPYEIVENEVLIGGTFIGDEFVDVETSLVGAEVLSLPQAQFFAARFTPSDTSPTVITATLSNDLGSTQEVSSLDYVNSHSPVIEYFYVHPTSDSELKYTWKVKGADSGKVNYLGEDVTSLDTALYSIDDIESGSFKDYRLFGRTGYLEIIFRNQYGDTVKVARLSQLVRCLPGSEDSSCQNN